jgi:hypothetical protein
MMNWFMAIVFWFLTAAFVVEAIALALTAPSPLLGLVPLIPALMTLVVAISFSSLVIHQGSK